VEALAGEYGKITINEKQELKITIIKFIVK